MKRAKTKEKVSKVDVWKGVINEIEQYVIFAYLFCMLCIFPLFYKEQYYKQLSIFSKDNDYIDSTNDLIRKLNELVGKNVFIKAKDVVKNDKRD